MNDDFDLGDLLGGIFGGPARDKKKNPRRRDFDVPLPADTKAWLRRITKKHRDAEAES